jgi:hypothetical protein
MPPEFRLPLIASDVLVAVGLDADTNRSDHSLDAALARPAGRFGGASKVQPRSHRARTSPAISGNEWRMGARH